MSDDKACECCGFKLCGFGRDVCARCKDHEARIRADEREACAKLADPEPCKTHGLECPHQSIRDPLKLAAAIRARGGGK